MAGAACPVSHTHVLIGLHTTIVRMSCTICAAMGVHPFLPLLAPSVSLGHLVYLSAHVSRPCSMGASSGVSMMDCTPWGLRTDRERRPCPAEVRPHPPPVQHAPYRETCTRQPALVRHSEARVDPQPEHHGGGEVPDLRSRARPPRGMGPAAVPPLPPCPRRPPRGGGAVPPRTAPRLPGRSAPAATGPRGARRPAAGQILVHQAAPLGQEVRETPGDRSAGQAQDGGTLRHRERLRHLEADAHREDGALVGRRAVCVRTTRRRATSRNGRPRRTGALHRAHQIGTGPPRCPGRSRYPKTHYPTSRDTARDR